MSERITNRQLDRITTWIESKTNSTCPFCGNRNWTVDDELGSLPAYQSEAPSVQLDRGYTFVLVTCEHCGFTAPFAAKKIEVDAAGPAQGAAEA
jgi:predicted nucleic-acid-binding Zn-ribbon protein